MAEREWRNGAIYALDLPGNSVQGLFDASGTITHRYRYTPFGEPLPSTSSAVVNPLRFAARELDAATGLYYVRARWYDPSRGRFLSEDPIGLAGGINNYAYAANDPVNMSDPTGLCYQGVYVTVLGTSEPCTSGWLGLSYLINRWNGIGDRDGRITSIMGGMVKGGGQDDGWRDDGPVRTPAEVSKSAATCWLNGAEGEVQIGAFAALGGNVELLVRRLTSTLCQPQSTCPVLET